MWGTFLIRVSWLPTIHHGIDLAKQDLLYKLLSSTFSGYHQGLRTGVPNPAHLWPNPRPNEVSISYDEFTTNHDMAITLITTGGLPSFCEMERKGSDRQRRQHGGRYFAAQAAIHLRSVIIYLRARVQSSRLLPRDTGKPPMVPSFSLMRYGSRRVGSCCSTRSPTSPVKEQQMHRTTRHQHGL